MLLWFHCGPALGKWPVHRANDTTVLTTIVDSSRIINCIFYTMCIEGAISPTVSKVLRAVDQDAIWCAEVIVWVTIVITTESTK